MSDEVFNQIYAKIQREKALINGAVAMRASSNHQVQQSLDAQTKEARKNIDYLEQKLRDLQMRQAEQGMEGMNVGGSSTGGPPPPSHGTLSPQQQKNNSFAPSVPPKGGYGSGDYGAQGQGGYSDQMGAGSGMMPPRAPYGPTAPGPIPKARPNYSRLDLIKADTQYLGPRFQLMLSQLTFKLAIEKQYKAGIEKLVRLYTDDRDSKSRSDAEGRLRESVSKIQLLTQALRRYEGLHVDMENPDTQDDDSINSPQLRKPLSGHLAMQIYGVKDVQHALTGRLTRSPETFVIIKVEDAFKGRTRATRTDKWTEEVHQIEIEKANEMELTVYDKASGREPMPIGMLWIRTSDIVEEMRRKKIESELSGSQWVTAQQMDNSPRGAGTAGYGGMAGPGGGSFMAPNVGGGASRGPPGMGPGEENDPNVIDAWFQLEPVGSIHLSMNFTKHNRGKAAFDLGLNRKGAVRQRKEDVMEQYGHRFITQQFYSIMRCALCGEFLKNAAGMQCEDCKYTCHRNCFSKVVTKCISKSNAETDPDEETLNHRIPHRFEPFSNIGANWCCHCGYILTLGKKNARKCTECSLTVHGTCSHLVPNFCGMSMLRANEILSTIMAIPKRPTLSEKTLRPSKPTRSTPAPQASYDPPPGGQQDPVSRPPATARQSYPYESTYDQQQRPQQAQAMAQDAAKASGYPQSPDRPNHPPRSQSSQQNANATAAAAAAAALGRPPAQKTSSYQQPASPDYSQAGPRTSGGGYRPMDSHVELDSSSSAAADRQRQSPQTEHTPYNPAVYAQYNQPQPYTQQPATRATATDLVAAQQAQTPVKSQAPPKEKPTQRVGLEHFNFLAVLGKGNFGKVMLAETKASKKLYAIKVLKKEFIIENDEVESTKSEKRVFLIANKERHPFLLTLHACFQTETRVYFVMDYISGGDLMLHIQRGQFGLKRAQFYASEVCLALKYFHENGVIYRDLKLDNIMLTLDGHIKVADYGLCKEDMWYGSTTSTFCGTPEFMAPEILLDKKYGRAVDWWAFGVLIYQMLLQQSPFRGEDEDEIYDAILADEPLYPIHMPRDSVSILQKLLTREPELRLGSGPTDAQEIMSHAFFRNVNWEDVRAKKVPPPFQPSIKNPTDTSNFDSEFTSVTPVLTPVQSVLTQAMQEEFRGFSYSADFI